MFVTFHPIAMTAFSSARIQASEPHGASAIGRDVEIAHLAVAHRNELVRAGDRIEVLLPSKDAIVETHCRFLDASAEGQVVRGPVIAITPPAGGQPSYRVRSSDALVIGLHPDFYRDSVVSALGCEAPEIAQAYCGLDPLLFEIGRSLLAEFRSRRMPSLRYRECWGRVIALHLANAYGQPRTQIRWLPGLSRRKLEEILTFIEEHLGDSMRVVDLANTANLSAYHFARLFKHTVGQTPHVYITARRMQHARKILSDSDLPLINVAARVGYQTQAHFTVAFRRYTGVTPRAYRLGVRAPDLRAEFAPAPREGSARRPTTLS